MNIIFQSSRLYFREFNENDVQLLYELNDNPNVIIYVHEPAPTAIKCGGEKKILATTGDQDASNLDKVIEVVKGLL